MQISYKDIMYTVNLYTDNPEFEFAMIHPTSGLQTNHLHSRFNSLFPQKNWLEDVRLSFQTR